MILRENPNAQSIGINLIPREETSGQCNKLAIFN